MRLKSIQPSYSVGVCIRSARASIILTKMIKTMRNSGKCLLCFELLKPLNFQDKSQRRFLKHTLNNNNNNWKKKNHPCYSYKQQTCPWQQVPGGLKEMGTVQQLGACTPTPAQLRQPQCWAPRCWVDVCQAQTSNDLFSGCPYFAS